MKRQGSFRSNGVILYLKMKTSEKKAYDRFYNRYVKRMLDFVLAVILFIPVLPLYIIISVLILLDDGFPVFYRPMRGGYRGRSFRIAKFRTMVKNADQIGGGTTANNDPRITRVGRILRKTKLDETANLINILQGTMSFIGPRPELLQYTDQYQGAEKEILEVRPGITDYSSIHFINLDEIVGAEDADAMYEKLVLKKKNALRIQYAETVSFSADVRLFFQTIRAVFQKSRRFIASEKQNKSL